MKETVPGWLYAKSLEEGGAMGGGYRTWFWNSELARHEDRLMQLRSQFHWVPDSGRRHPPVVVVEPGTDGGKALLVRFSDAGVDSFGRSQTLRMEAMLVAEADVARCWDGAFKAEPDEGRACFLIEAPEPSGTLSSFGNRRLVIGDPTTFSLGNVPRPATAGPGGSVGGEAKAAPPPPAPRQKPKAEPTTTGRKKPRWLFALVIFALLVSAAGNIVQCLTSAALKNETVWQRTRLEALLEREKQLPEKERQLAEREQIQKAKEGDLQEREGQLLNLVVQMQELATQMQSVLEGQPKGDEERCADVGNGYSGERAEIANESSPVANASESGKSG